MTQSWFPDGNVRQNVPYLKCYAIDNLDMQSRCEGGFYDGFQLGQGRFDGRVAAVNLGDQAIYSSYSNQPIAKQIDNRSSDYFFVVALDHHPDASTRKGLIYGHKTEPSQLVGIVPPNSKCVRGTPPHVTTLKLRVCRRTLLAQLTSYPELAEWFESLTDCTTVHSPFLATRLRQDLSLVFDSAVAVGNARTAQIFNRAVLTSIVQSFALEFVKHSEFKALTHSQSFTTLCLALPKIHRQLEEFYENPTAEPFQLDQLREFGSRRSIEKSFADCFGVGPRTYSRIVQLHHFRRRLITEAPRKPKIANLAAEFGFWDAGRLSSHYRRHFGETPTKTLQNASRREDDRSAKLRLMPAHQTTHSNARQSVRPILS